MKILIVDDEEAICLRLQKELEKEGHEVYYETSPLRVQEELKKARRENKPYNLLLLNIQMPGMDGLTLFSRIREERLGVEAIIMTGYHEEQVVIEAIRLSVKDYLNKPISLEELSACVSHAQERLIEEANNNGKHRILVIDDEKALADRVKRELEKEGYTVAVVYNGQDGLDHFERHRVDMLIVDVRMPAMDGLELIDRCQQINNDFTSIVITGHGDHEIAREALKKGVFDYLKKPLSLDKLITSVKKGFEQRNIRRGKLHQSRRVMS